MTELLAMNRLLRKYPELEWGCRKYKLFYKDHECIASELCKKLYPNLICELGYR